jgi:hypothetical protein
MALYCTVLRCDVLYMPELPIWDYRSAHNLQVPFYSPENDV